MDKNPLIEKLRKLKESLDVDFREIDNAELPEEYSDILQKNHNPDIEKPFKKKIVNEGK